MRKSRISIQKDVIQVRFERIMHVSLVMNNDGKMKEHDHIKQMLQYANSLLTISILYTDIENEILALLELHTNYHHFVDQRNAKST